MKPGLKVDVKDDHIWNLAVNEVQGLARIGCAPGRETVLGERCCHEIADHRIVIHHKHTTAWSHVDWLIDRGPVCKKRTDDISVTARQQIFMRCHPDPA